MNRFFMRKKIVFTQFRLVELINIRNSYINNLPSSNELSFNHTFGDYKVWKLCINTSDSISDKKETINVQITPFQILTTPIKNKLSSLFSI